MIEIKNVKFKSLINYVYKKAIFIGSRTAILYLLMFLLLSAIVDHDKRMVRTLNQLMPDFGYLSEIARNPQKIDIKKLKRYVKYYEKVVEYTPDNASAHGLLGFCYYHQGRYKKAIASYKKAVEIHPVFFWFNYNLGVLYFKEGRYEEAIASFTQALRARWEVTLSYIHNSVAYQRIIAGDFDYHTDTVTKRLNAAYHRCCMLTVISRYYLEDFPSVLRDTAYALDRDIGDKKLFYYYAGIAAYKIKWYTQAVNFLQKYISISPASSDAYTYLGLSLKELGDKAKGEYFLKQAESLGETRDPAISIEDEVTLQIF